MSERDVDEIVELVKALLNVWEHAVGRENTLRLVLNDCCPDWKHHYMKYVDDPGTVEHTKMIVGPLRRLSEAALRGELTHSLVEQATQDILKKPN